MTNRRDFLKQAALLASAAGIPSAIQRAMAIEPAPGSTWEDAEHVVILMQENRSFDHCLGSLRGVRGFNDPRAVTLPSGLPVWCQVNGAGETCAPFRLDLKGSNATWLGCLPHDWADQSLARNQGKHDRWLDTKRPMRQTVSHLPLTLGYHNREDLPFYYALADAFTVCDQNFCSSLTGTNPNRLHLWSGTIRPEPHPESRAHVRNHDAETHEGVKWKSFPERLEEHGVSWRVYQNELYLNTGLTREQTPWLGNFGDNALEFFARYGVRYARRHREWLAGRLVDAEALLTKLLTRPKPWTPEMEQEVAAAARSRDFFLQETRQWTEARFQALSEMERRLHTQAFTTNEGDPDFRELEEVTYDDAGTARKMKVPKGDVLHQFRQDVAAGKLPAISWLVAPQVFSDHPDSPWYGAWYISEALDILTKNEALWRKTIFILCYDENDGYFDHMPPFVPPDPAAPETGRASQGLKTELEFVRAAQEEAHRAAFPKIPIHTGPIGLGYRVPLVIASPWSRGGWVNSQVFDHTSILQFLEKFASRKTGREIRETNITPWRRAMCGDLTSVFRPAGKEAGAPVSRVERDAFLGEIHKAQFKPAPAVPRPLSPAELETVRREQLGWKGLPRQEPGTRPACALPYELEITGHCDAAAAALVLNFSARNRLFAGRSAGAPFHVYAPGLCHPSAAEAAMESGRTWAFAVKAGDAVVESWPLRLFDQGRYHLRAHGPNGFYREFTGSAKDPALTVKLTAMPEGKALLILSPANGTPPFALQVKDLSYGAAPRSVKLEQEEVVLTIEAPRSHGWYDLLIIAEGFPDFSRRLAGHLESGAPSRTDPLMGREAI